VCEGMVGWRASEVQTIAREAEEAGFRLRGKVNNDVTATVQLMGRATRRVTVGTWDRTHLPAPFLCPPTRLRLRLWERTSESLAQALLESPKGKEIPGFTKSLQRR